MADTSVLKTIAKLLARATSSERAEAETALNSAFKRMQRDHVTFEALLTLHANDLYEETLYQLVTLILNHQTDLSPQERREAYTRYTSLIRKKFGDPNQDSGTGFSDREDAANDYFRRNQYDHQNGPNHKKEESSHAASSENTAGNGQKTAFNAIQTDSEGEGSHHGKKSVLRAFFAHGSILWFVLNFPLLMLRLFSASLLWGIGFSFCVVTIGATLHAVSGIEPLIDVGLRNLFVFCWCIGSYWKWHHFKKMLQSR